MTKETIIPQLSKDRKDRIKKIMKYHYGFEPKDKEINWLDEMFRNHYLVLHDQKIIKNLVTVKINEILLKHREKMGSIKFEELLFSKSIFQYLTLASMSYRAGIPIATIILCRTALEAGLREIIAEELVKKEDIPSKKLSKAIWDKMENVLKEDKLHQLIEKADDLKIISKKRIEKILRKIVLFFSKVEF